MADPVSNPGPVDALQHLYQEEMRRYKDDQDRGHKEMQKHQATLNGLLEAARSKLFQKGNPDPFANLSQEQRMAVQYVQDTMARLPGLIPHIAAYAMAKTREIGNATITAMGPLPVIPDPVVPPGPPQPATPPNPVPPTPAA
jgi:hypothetical protein